MMRRVGVRAFPWQEDKTEPIAITKISAHEPHKADDKGTGEECPEDLHENCSQKGGLSCED